MDKITEIESLKFTHITSSPNRSIQIGYFNNYASIFTNPLELGVTEYYVDDEAEITTCSHGYYFFDCNGDRWIVENNKWINKGRTK